MITTKYTLGYRRKREGRTNYKKRLALLKCRGLRVAVRRSLKNIMLQLIQYGSEGDKVLVTADSKELKRFGWRITGGNLPAAYLTGLLLAKKALQSGYKEGIVDIGLHRSTKGARIYAAVKGMLDGGFKVPCSEDILPSEERYTGKHIEQYSKLVAADKQRYQKLYAQYIKENVKPEEISKLFNKAKEQITKGA